MNKCFTVSPMFPKLKKKKTLSVIFQVVHILVDVSLMNMHK